MGELDYDKVQEYLFTLVPPREPEMIEMEKYAEKNDFPIIGPVCGYYCYQLADLLNEKGYPTEVTVVARTGWTTADLWYGLEKVNPQGTYDLVTLLIGVNDQFRGYPIDVYREDFQFMLRKAIEYVDGNAERVIVLSIPDYGYTPASSGRDIEGISLKIDAFNAVNRDEAEQAGAYYVDVTTISRMASDDFELTAGDRLHPSGKMYAMWVKKLLPVALEIIKR